MCGYCREPLNQNLLEKLKDDLPKDVLGAAETPALGFSGWISMGISAGTSALQSSTMLDGVFADNGSAFANAWFATDTFDFQAPQAKAQEADPALWVKADPDARTQAQAADPAPAEDAAATADWVNFAATALDDWFG